MWVGSIDVGWVNGKRKRVTVSAKSQADALDKFAKAKAAVAAAGGVLPTKLTVEAWLTYWLDHIAAERDRPRTVQSYRSIIERHLIPALGKKRLDQLTPQHVRQLLRTLERGTDTQKPLSASMVTKIHVVLKGALTDAMREEHVTRNVATLVEKPRSGAVRDRGAYTIDQARTLLTVLAAHPDASRWATALLLGPRPGEVLGLQIDRVNLAAGEVRIDRQLQRIPYRHGCGSKQSTLNGASGWPCGRRFGGDCPQRELAIPRGFLCEPIDGSVCLTLPKSKAGERTAPLTPGLVELYQTQIERQAHRVNPHGLMWTRDDGRPLDAKEDRKAWAALVKSAGLPPLDLYAARHTAVTMLLEGGTDVKVVGQLVGHTNPTTTRGYQHVTSAVARAAIEQHSARMTEET
jgi:integrase